MLDRHGRGFRRTAGGTAVAALAALAVTLPGNAAAAPTATLVAGPVAVHGYQLTLIASSGASASLTVNLVRKAGGATQTHVYSFKLSPSALKVAPRLASASLVTGTQLGGFGAVTMRLARAGKLTRGTSCGATFSGRSGTLAGSLRLVLDTTFFRTVVERSLPARLSSGTSKLTCAPPPPTRNQPGLTLTALPSSTGAGGPIFTAAKTAAGAVTEAFFVSEQRAPASITHSIVAKAAASAFTAAADLSSAHLDGGAGAPFLGGALDFAAQAPAQSAAGCTQAVGQLSGSLVGHFDSIGDQTAGSGTGFLIHC
jgi:hypothetical protein